MILQRLKNILALCALLCAGCVSAPPNTPLVQNVSQLPSIQTVNAGRLAKLRIGMPFADFQKIFPDAYRLDDNNGRKLSVYEIVSMTHYVTKTDLLEGMFSQAQSTAISAYFQALRFYFKNDRLVRWLQPKAWPSKLD